MDHAVDTASTSLLGALPFYLLGGMVLVGGVLGTGCAGSEPSSLEASARSLTPEEVARRDSMQAVRAEHPPVLIQTRVRADQLRVETKGNVQVTGIDTLKRTTRVNLPDTLRTNTVYRDIQVYYELVSRFDTLRHSEPDSLSLHPDTTQQK